MKYKQINIDRDKYYSIGIDEENGDYIMEVIMMGIAWYSRYYKISEDEFQYFKKKDKKKLDNLAKSFALSFDNNRDRFFYSDHSI